MPGIHVRTVGKRDWSQQSEESLLTVPGSYWLCHKNNIYKFIFKYHRTIRNNVEFKYGKELMKIIRKIIKCQPRQGQQFGTHHLLVTYNHTSWTRQDKMFAMLKFKERTDASAYAHAFVLTVKFIGKTARPAESSSTAAQSEHFLRSDDKGSGSIKNDIKNGKRNVESSSPARNKDAPHSQGRTTGIHNDAANTKLEESVISKKKPASKASSTGNTHNSNSDTSTSQRVLTRSSITSSNKAEENKSLEIDLVKLKKLEQTHKTSSRRLLFLNEKINSIQEDSTTATESRHPTTEGRGTSTDVDKNENIKSLSLADSKRTSTENTSSSKNNIVTNNDGSMDSANLPYQYLIEKEIEDARNKTPSHRLSSHSGNITRQSRACKRSMQNSSQQKSPEESSSKKCKVDADELDALKNQDSSCTKLNKLDRHRLEKKSDSKTARSSDITNLVMEGLMFTIRQGQDSVAVIEQKTKLEVDEVLENSEKAETKEGEKCLRNSSLLGLENLITMLEFPDQAERKHKLERSLYYESALQLSERIRLTRHADRVRERESTESKLTKNFQSLQWPTFRTVSSASTSFAKNFSSSLSQECTRKESILYNYLNGEEDEEEEEEEEEQEEEEDIVPEVLQGKILKSGLNASTVLRLDESTLDRDLLMDDIEFDQSMNKDSIKFPFTGINIRNNESFVGNHTPKCDTGSTRKSVSKDHRHDSSTPRVVSNQIITMDQMPLALQKALRDKLEKRNTSRTDTSEALTNDSVEDKRQTSDETGAISDIHLTTQKLLSDYVQNSLCPSISETSVNNDNIVHDESVPVVESEMKLDGNDIPDNAQKIEGKKSKTERHSSSKSKKSTPNEPQDITQDFYNHLSTVQRKNSSTENRCLRQRRKTSKSCTDDKNSEIRVEMLKFIQDITRGAKVVITRMSTKSISDLVGKSSSLTTCMH